jgi:hypothetical protein
MPDITGDAEIAEAIARTLADIIIFAITRERVPADTSIRA